MSRAAQATRNTITLKGSTEIVTEFFGYSINSILYQRGIYPPESFNKVQKYGLSMLVTSDSGLQNYLQQVLSQLTGGSNPEIPSCCGGPPGPGSHLFPSRWEVGGNASRPHSEHLPSPKHGIASECREHQHSSGRQPSQPTLRAE
jgi:hypothetical protein